MTVTYAREDHVAVLTLGAPERRNALSRAIVQALSAGLDRACADRARAIIITGSNGVFCAGANIDDLRDGWMERGAPESDPTRFFRRLATSELVSIAAVQGFALGGGLELTLACDLVVADDSAIFAAPELAHGVIPPTSLALLAACVGRRLALDMILTQRRLTAKEALAAGLVSRVAEQDPRAEAVTLARTIVTNAPPGALTSAKRHFRHHHGVDWDYVIASPETVPAAQWREGLQSFLEKRRPDYERFWRSLEG